MKTNIEPYLISPGASVLSALDALNALSGGAMTLFVTDEARRLLGTVTDGDIRRALIAGTPLDAPLSEVMNTRFSFARSGGDRLEALREARRKGIDLLPVIDEDVLAGIIEVDKVSTMLPADAVLMAGGRGERLRPLTDKVPKPLLKVGAKPIIDYNVEALERAGVENIFVTVNYLAPMIKEHFGSRKNVAKITCIEEPRRLGTMGSLSLIEDFTHDHILLMNSDLLTDIDFERLWLHHVESGAEMTMCGVPYTLSVPYAVMELEKDRVKSLVEKPSFNYLANAGVYLLRRSLLKRLKKGEYMDAPDFISALIADGAKVASFTIEGRWIDIGSPADFNYANEILQHG